MSIETVVEGWAAAALRVLARAEYPEVQQLYELIANHELTAKERKEHRDKREQPLAKRITFSTVSMIPAEIPNKLADLELV
ncbi:MAG: hypothetical protein KJ052_20525 [Candidatus Hydrogenedentes bacterium]|nr:hypothetical protein [Candidatus Hydrogenedentota bacterium]